MDLSQYVWYQIWTAVQYVFTGTFQLRWMFSRLPENQWVETQFLWQIPPANSVAPTYPSDLAGVAELDAQNYQRAIAVYDAVVPLIQSYLADGQFVWFDVFVLRPPGLPDFFSLRFDLYYFPGPEFLRVEIGQVVSLPFAVRPGVSVGEQSMFAYSSWQLNKDMDEESRAAILEIRDGLRPWTYGNSLVPVPNDGQPGLLELHRQVTGEETLGVYYQPTLRDLVKEASSLCVKELVGRRVWVKVDVSGNRAGANDSQLPHGDASWVHNHYGQVRLRWQYPSDRRERFSEWRWIRARESVEVFNLPWVQGEIPVVTPQVRRYAGLTVTAQVISGATVSCDSVGGSDGA